jgi:hypothetical protein
MLIVNAVLETPDTVAFSFWPVADLPPYQFMALPASMSPLDVGSALAMLADHNSRTGDDDRPVKGASEAIRRLLDTDKVIAPGGLRVHDTRTNVTVQPACCCGLEDWREWLDVADGETLWLGHDPSPRLEHADEFVQLWPDSADAQEASQTRRGSGHQCTIAGYHWPTRTVTEHEICARACSHDESQGCAGVAARAACGTPGAARAIVCCLRC